MWAALTPAYTLTATQNSSNSAYGSNYNVTINKIRWNAPGNQNFDGYWRIGGKKAKAADATFSANRVITGIDAISGQIKKVTFNHKGKSADGIGVPSVTLTIASDAAFNTVVDEIVVNPTIAKSTTGSFDFTPTTPLTYWDGCYYKFTINVTNTTTTNGGIDLASIVFYEEGADVAITEITLPSTADVAVGRTKALTATVTPNNHTGSVDWESDNTSIATVTSEGVVTGVATGSTTIRAKSHADNTIKAECTVTVIEDVATLPFIWAGGSSSSLTALTGVAGKNLSDYADNDSNRPYLVKFDAVGDYIQIRTNGQPGKVSVGIKMLGGATTSKIKVQESSNGTDFTDVQELTVSGELNDIVNLVTTNSFATTSRYVRIIKSVHASGGNIGVGPISIAESGEPALPLVSGTTVTLTTTSNMAGWRTYDNNTSKKYTVDGTTKVFYVSETGENKVTLTEIDGGVPANTVVILHQTSGTTITLTETNNVITAPVSNLLQVSEANDNLGTVYRLGYKASHGVGFYTYTSASAPAGIIYIDTVNSARDFLGFDFGEENVTAIESIKAQKLDGQYFNLAGQRVAQPTKGLCIVNGKKFLIK